MERKQPVFVFDSLGEWLQTLSLPRPPQQIPTQTQLEVLRCDAAAVFYQR
jgi:hypothetical protein